MHACQLKSTEIGAKRPATSSSAVSASALSSSAAAAASPVAAPATSPAPSPATPRASRASASHRSISGRTQWYAVSSSAGGGALAWASAGDVAPGAAVSGRVLGAAVWGRASGRVWGRGRLLSRLPEQTAPSMMSATTPRAARAQRERQATSIMQPPEAPTRLHRRAGVGGRGEGVRGEGRGGGVAQEAARGLLGGC